MLSQTLLGDFTVKDLETEQCVTLSALHAVTVVLLRNFVKINLKFPYIGLQSFPYDLNSSKYTLFFVFLYEGV